MELSGESMVKKRGIQSVLVEFRGEGVFLGVHGRNFLKYEVH